MLFCIYDLNGSLIKNVPASFVSRYHEYDYDNIVTLRTDGEQIHCLQKYGTTYRVYDSSGNVVREFQLQYNPLDDKKIEKRKDVMYMFNTFCFDDKYVYATGLIADRIMIGVFDWQGKLVRKLIAPQPDQGSFYQIADMNIRKEGARKLLHFYVCDPVSTFFVADVTE
jgi:hypothetical protein